MFFFSRRRGFFVFGFATALLHLLRGFSADAHGLLRALASPGVRMGALAPDGQAAAVADPLVRTDLDLPLDVLSHVPAKVPFDLVVALDPLADPNDLVLGQVAHLPATLQPR